MKSLILTLSVMVLMSVSSFAQKDTVAVQGYYETGGTYGTLNDAIQAARDAGTTNSTVFKLNPFELYVLSSSIFIDHGESLDIWAPKPGTTQESAPPQIVWTEEEIDNDYIVQSYGDVRMQNIWIRHTDILGNKIQTSVTFENQEAAADPEVGYFNGVLFDYAGIGAEAGGSVTVKADHFEGTFLNCHFRNNSDNHFQYYGRAVSFPFQSSGWHYDYLLFENSTFTNLSRIVMMEGNEFGDNIHLNHVTLLNSVEWVIQQGWYKNLSVTNSIFVNPFMLGYRAVDVCDEDQDFDDFEDGLCDPPGGALAQDIVPVDSFGFEVDFTDMDRQIYAGYNNYHYYDWFVDWMENCDNICQDRTRERRQDELRHPAPAFGGNAIAYMDSMDAEGNKVFVTMNIDSTKWWDVDPEFIVPATNMDSLMIFMENKWDDNADIDWSFMPLAGLNQVWPLPENLAYNAELQTAGMGGFPLGDLNWWPDQLEDWAAQRDQEWAQINDWMENGLVTTSNESVGELPSGYRLEQNYPNPFNPSTQITYSVPTGGNISLRVHNALGQVVATLVEGRSQAGTHTVSFDASGLTSGVYYYRLENENGVGVSRKLVLIK